MNERLYLWLLRYAPLWVIRLVPYTWRRRQGRAFVVRLLEHRVRRQ
jgi:hypothetical protein